MVVETYANFADGLLSADIDNTTTSIPLIDASAFTSPPPFRILVDDEVMLISALAGSTMTAARGQEGTTRAAHSAGARAVLVVTAAQLNSLMSSLGGVGSTPGPALNVLDHGAKGDCRLSSSGKGSQVNPNRLTIGGADETFLAGRDEDKMVLVQGAGVNYGMIEATIDAVVSTTQVTIRALDDPITVSSPRGTPLKPVIGSPFGNSQVMWGTNDAPAIQALLDSLPGANDGVGGIEASGGELIFPSANYLLRPASTPKNEVQTVTITGSPTGGTWTLKFIDLSGNQTTAAIAYNATAAQVQAALEALLIINKGNVVVAGPTGGPYQITFQNNLGYYPQQLMVATSSLTGGTSPAITVVHTTVGAEAFCLFTRKQGVKFSGVGSAAFQPAMPGWFPSKAGGPCLVVMEPCSILALGQPEQNIDSDGWPLGGDGHTSYQRPRVQGLNFLDWSGEYRAIGLHVSGCNDGHVEDCAFLKLRVGVEYKGYNKTGDASWWFATHNTMFCCNIGYRIDNILTKIDGGFIETSQGQIGVLQVSGLYTEVTGIKFHASSSSGNKWKPSTVVSNGDFYRPSAAALAAGAPLIILKCKTAGTTGTTEPTWTAEMGHTYTDGTAEWLQIDKFPSDAPLTCVLADSAMVATGYVSGDSTFCRGRATPSGGLLYLNNLRIEHHDYTFDVDEGANAAYGIDIRYVLNHVSIQSPMMGGGGDDPTGTGILINGSKDGTKTTSGVVVTAGQINFFVKGIVLGPNTTRCVLRDVNVPLATGTTLNNIGHAIEVASGATDHLISGARVELFSDLADSGTRTTIRDIRLTAANQLIRTTTGAPTRANAIGDEMIDTAAGILYKGLGGTSWLGLGSSGAAYLLGSGSPEGVTTGNVGDVYKDTTNGLIYIKSTGTGNTGWAELLQRQNASSLGNRKSSTTWDEYPFDRGFWAANNNMTAGTVIYNYFTARRRRTITRLGVYVQAAPTAATATLVRLGLYTAAANGDITPVAHTDNVPTLFDSTGQKLSALVSKDLDGTASGFWPTSYTLLEGVDYCIGVVAVGYSGSLALRGGNWLQGLCALGNPSTASKSGQTDIGGTTGHTPAAVTWGSLSQSGVSMGMFVAD